MIPEPHGTPTLIPREILDRSLDFLIELTALSSPSFDAAGLGQTADFLARALAARGFETSVEPHLSPSGTALPVFYARGPEATRSFLLLLGHMDTVLPSIPPKREENRLRATGAIDMKGGLAAFVGALDLLAARGLAPARDLLLLVVPDEEVGGEISRERTLRHGAQARAVWVLEPGDARGDAETIVAGRRGLTSWRLDVSGTAAHSGLAYWQGRSALAAAALFATRAQALSRPGPGVTVNVGRLVAGDREFVEQLRENAALLGTDSRLNVISDRAIAEGELRYLRASEGEALRIELEALTREIATEYQVEMTLTVGEAIPPVDPHGPQRAWGERAIEAARERGWQLSIEEDRGGISFPNFLGDPGRVPVLDGLGPVGGGMHTREEFLDLRSFERRIALLADLLAADAAER